jgi:hypothetical protein
MKRNLKFTFVLVLAFLFVSCGSFGNTVKQNPEQAAYYAYDKALQWYTQSAETYEMHYQLADAQTKAKWKSEIDPIFKDMKKVLDNWKTSLSVGFFNSTNDQDFKTLKTRIILMGLNFFKE